MILETNDFVASLCHCLSFVGKNFPCPILLLGTWLHRSNVRTVRSFFSFKHSKYIRCLVMNCCMCNVAQSVHLLISLQGLCYCVRLLLCARLVWRYNFASALHEYSFLEDRWYGMGDSRRRLTGGSQLTGAGDAYPDARSLLLWLSQLALTGS